MRKKENGDSPATQHDLAILAGEMTRRFDVLESGQDSMRADIARLESGQESMREDIARLERGQESLRADIARLERGQQAMLGVLQSIDEHFRDHRNLPERVARLERSEFGRS